MSIRYRPLRDPFMMYLAGFLVCALIIFVLSIINIEYRMALSRLQEVTDAKSLSVR